MKATVISLSGFMGCGKSTVGAILRDKYALPLVDLDTLIETSTGSAIPEIFSSLGEGGFREIEYNCLRDFLEDDAHPSPIILSLGGGTLTYAPSRALINECTLRIYFRASLDTLLSNLQGRESGRPMLEGEGTLRDRISSLLERRMALYEGEGVHIIDTDGLSFDDIALKVMDIITEAGEGGILPNRIY